MTEVDRILDGWFGESLEDAEDEDNLRRHLYEPLRKLVSVGDLARKDQALRNIAEGNLGDAPWQANYTKIREIARSALFDAADVEAAARRLERARHPEWTDEQFEIWWTKDPFFTQRVTNWNHFGPGTRKEHVIWEAKQVLGIEE